MFTDIFIKRPVLSCTVSLIILLCGCISFFNLDVRQFPNVQSSTINIFVNYPGANADLMEGFVTTPIENAISSIDGIDYLESSSQKASTMIAVHMKVGYDIDIAATTVSNKVNSIRWKLPDDIRDPVVEKQDSNAQPIMYLLFSSSAQTPEQLTDYLIRVVQPQLQSLTGVSQAHIFGDREYAMRLWLNPFLMAAHQITATDIQSALKQNNIQSTAGSIRNSWQQYDVRASTDMQTAAQFNHLILSNNHGHIVRLKDVGKAKLGSATDNFSVYVNNKQTIFVGIIPKSNANPLDVAKLVNHAFSDLKQHLPSGINASLFWDSSKFISASLEEVTKTIFEACLFVFLVIFLMIGSVRAVFVPIVTIPLSIIGTLALMLLFHFTINTLTLLAFVLAIGLVVDDAIVILENIHRHLAEGLSPKKAAMIGAREISFAVIAMTLTLAAVYTPIGFMTGLTGTLFTEFAFTLAGAVVISGCIALTLSPMMCSKIYKQNENLNSGFPGIVNRTFDIIIKGYKHSLNFFLKHWYIALIFAAVVYVGCAFLFMNTPSEMVPSEDQGVVLAMARGPASASIDYTEKHTKPISEILKTVPEIENRGIINGYPGGLDSAIAIATLTPWNQRKKTADQIIQQLFPKLWAIPGIEVYPVSPPLLPGTTSLLPIEFVLQTTDTYHHLEKYGQKLLTAINQWGGLTNTDLDLKFDKDEVEVNINRKVADDLNISMTEISNALSIGLSKPITTRFNMKGRNYEVLPQLYRKYRNSPNALKNLFVRTTTGKLVPLSNVANISESIVPRSLNHFQQLRSATISGNLAPGVTQGEAYKKITELAKQTLPSDIQTDTSGQLRQYIQAAGKMVPTFIFAIIFIYLILAAQFESFKDPFIVMLSVPLSIAGGLGLLMLFGGTLNIYTEIGLVTLVGLITKNGILIVEFANQQQEKGVEFRDAILTAASYRLRPILMTTFSMLLGILPLALASGAGAVSRSQIGLVLIGGMSFGTLLTLYVIPVAYYLFATKKSAEDSLDALATNT